MTITEEGAVTHLLLYFESLTSTAKQDHIQMICLQEIWSS